MEPSDEDLAALETEGFKPLIDLNDPLEDLFTEAQFAAANGKKVRKAADPAKKNHLDAAAKSMHDLFALSENWTRTKGIALIHKESETLLGNFSEYLHNTVKGARKLVREESPISVSASEYVEGSWWLGADVVLKPREEWREKRRAMVKIHLPSLGLFAPLVEIEAHIAFGGIHRIELVEETQFAAETGKILVTLPAGVNVLEELSWDAKVGIKKELGL
jgi:hypothetical protein